MTFEQLSRIRLAHNTAAKSRDDPFMQLENPFGSSEAPPLRLPDVLGIMHRRWRWLIIGCIFGLTLSLSYILLATPLYTSTASILIDTRMNQNLQTQKIVEDTPVDTSLVDSQVQVLSSESIILPVIKSMNLTHDSEFVGPPDALGQQILWWLKGLITTLKQSLGLKDDTVVDANALLERTAVETFLKLLSPKREELTYVIDIAFKSEDPIKAARIANAVADTYVAASLEAKYTSTKIASDWLKDRLIELKVQTTDADRTLQNYKTANNIVETGRGLLDQQQISDLTSQLISARTATAEAKARLDRIQQISADGIPDATVTDALNNSVITRLRAQYLDAAARAADLTSRVGKAHQAVAMVTDQMDELRKSIRNEERRIADAYSSDYEIAKAREKSLTDSMSELVGEAGTSSQAQVTMRDLESSADTYRNLYNSFLQKFQETIQAQTIPVTDTRIVTKATPALSKSAPKSTLALAGGVLLGLFLGGGAAIAREWTAEEFRTHTEVEQITGALCLGILPSVRPNRNLLRRLAPLRSPGPALSENIAEFVLKSPNSRFAETLRNIKILINAARLGHDVKVIGIVSSVAGEGKTTIAANFGTLLAASPGVRTLVIDCDVRQRSLTGILAPDAHEGLIEALANPSRLASFVYHRKHSRLDVLPCVSAKAISNAADLLGSRQMEELLTTARDSYDYIIVEIPPIVPVVDAKAIARFIDSFVFVVEWGRSKRSLVLEALSNSEIIHDRLIGIVLNKADPAALRSIEAYKGKQFKSYYAE